MITKGLLDWLFKSRNKGGTETFDATTDSLEAIRDKVDTLPTSAGDATAAELAKVPKSDSTVSWNATALGAINAEVDTALNTAVPATPTAGSLNDFLSKAAGGNTFDKSTDSLEAIRDKIDTLPTSGGAIICREGACDAGMGASTTSIVCAGLAGYGDDYFNTKFWLAVVKNANSVGNAPELEIRQITDYTSVSGTFTTSAFSANVEANDSIIVLHESLPFLKVVDLTSGSGNWTVPTGATIADVIVVGAGGAGGGHAGQNPACGGGGGGEILEIHDFVLKNRTTISYAVGAKGVGTNTDGPAGGASTFDGLSAAGGSGGKSPTTGTGGDGGGTGKGTGGAAANPGTAGTSGTESGVKFMRIGGGGGGGGSTTSTAGGNGGRGEASGGTGGAGAGGNPGGGAGGGSLGPGATGGTNAGAGNSAGTNNGAGGGGSSGTVLGTRNGGDGSDGLIRIMWR